MSRRCMFGKCSGIHPSTVITLLILLSLFEIIMCSARYQPLDPRERSHIQCQYMFKNRKKLSKNICLKQLETTLENYRTGKFRPPRIGGWLDLEGFIRYEKEAIEISRRCCNPETGRNELERVCNGTQRDGKANCESHASVLVFPISKTVLSLILGAIQSWLITYI